MVSKGEGEHRMDFVTERSRVGGCEFGLAISKRKLTADG